MNENIIDITMDKHKDVPITLNGEVLLERTVDSNGNLSGYLTMKVESIQNLKNIIQTEGTKCSAYKYKDITDSF